MKRITMYKVAELFAQAYGTCATVEKGIHGFLCTGIFPFNADMFSNEDFAPASVSELDLEAASVMAAVESTPEASVKEQPSETPKSSDL